MNDTMLGMLSDNDIKKFLEVPENDTAENKEFLLTTPELAYWYCANIGHDDVIARRITKSGLAFQYCTLYKDCPCVAMWITGEQLGHYKGLKKVKSLCEEHGVGYCGFLPESSTCKNT